MRENENREFDRCAMGGDSGASPLDRTVGTQEYIGRVFCTQKRGLSDSCTHMRLTTRSNQRDRHRNREHQSSGARHQARCEQEATNELAHARRPCEEFGRWKAKRSNDLGEAGGRWQFCEPVPECNRDPDHDPQDREAGVRQCRSRSLSSKKKPLQGPSPLQIHTARSNQGPYRVSASFRQGPGGR
jgi:hypothetical protein